MAEATPGEIIGRNIRAVREAGLYTRSELAKRSGVSASTIEDVELGLSARPRRTTIEKLARGLGVDVARLMEGTGDEAPKAEAPPSQASLFNGLDEEDRRSRLEEIREDYRASREGLNRYCDAWERRIARDDLDRESVREFLVAADALFPALGDAVVSELMEIASIVGTAEDGGISDEMRSEASVKPAVDRYREIGRRLEAVWRERFAADADAPTVVDFQAHLDDRVRRRTA
ncbi:MAG TPA: helix-turn-helix transcriptional regulator [Rubrobacteraceae bacterium]|nr:helix-turn-helix transcriptional regulator [Rubrobacteraceae bacterium]